MGPGSNRFSFSLSAPSALPILRKRTNDLDAKLIYFLYRALQWAAFPFILLYFVFRSVKDRRYLRRFPERLGFLPPGLRQPAPGAIWLHAVSVGEVLSTVELLRRLRAQLPSVPLFVSTTTLAGRALADQKLAGVADGVFYAPIDFRFAVRRVLRALRPAVVVVAETEIWPNLYREVKRSGSGLVIVNGRISDNAQPRYLRWAWFFRRVLRWPDRILAQSEVSRQRYLALGAPPERVMDGGNLKYDLQPLQAGVPEAVRLLLERTAPREVWIAASTMAPAWAGDVDEDEVVVDAFRTLCETHPGLLLILVPRKPERFDLVAQKLQAKGVSFTRRSQVEAITLPGVLLLDSMGELVSLFALDSVVFMGGTLAGRGGHNILEPALAARAIVVGPHMENFPQIAAAFRAGGGCVEIEGPQALASAIDRLLRALELRLELGERAKRLALANRGATERAAGTILELHSAALPRLVPTTASFPLLWLLSWLWRFGSAGKRRWDLAHSQRLTTPVISIGGLSMGGSGKTPFVLWLAGKLRDSGLQPAILTRGYRRRSPEKRTVLEAGASAPVARTGDEAQILLQSGVAPLGIGQDRAATGRAVEQRFHPGVLILDDGFQHWRLQRDVDIVLVDGLDPLAGGYVFPLGRLRETPEALGRADALVITRAEASRSYRGVEQALRLHNPGAPIFRARVSPECWVELESGRQLPPEGLPFSRLAAFCGLASPASFWRTLGSLGYQPARRWGFGDHHRYRPAELSRLGAAARQLGVDALLTTEKDAMNLCEQAASLIAPIRLYWLKIGIEVEDQERLLGIILSNDVFKSIRRQGSRG